MCTKVALNAEVRRLHFSISLVFSSSVMSKLAASSSSTMLCHRSLLAYMSSHATRLPGSRLVSATMSGATMKSVKLSDSCAWDVVLRSMLGDTGSPSAFSLSPCRKNSASTRSDQRLDSAHGFAGLLMSAACRMVLTTTSRSCLLITDEKLAVASEPTPCGSTDGAPPTALAAGAAATAAAATAAPATAPAPAPAPAAAPAATAPPSAPASSCFLASSIRSTHAFSSSVSPKWHVMSVARMDAMMTRRTSRYWPRSNPSSRPVAGARSKAKATAQWWFSSTDWSEYRSASGVDAFIWYALFSPGCSRSWQIEASSRPNTSSSDR
mmetsp:Transcript_28222/g.91227  ORF Transcript_28222/g.91227 Transcript_28222/m.91227 type:complete len:324 (+) Transcript_28222:718-1689(+)